MKSNGTISFHEILNTLKNDKLRNELEQLSSHHVRSLYWLLFSPCPIKQGGVEGVSLFPEDWIEALKLSSKLYFEKLDQDPDPLILFLSKGNTYRLGMYAERLLCFFFDTFSETELLLHNFQIIDQKKTLGEVDFIIKWNNRTIHIELATKYYLAVNSTDDFHKWVGPSGNDSLERKIKKVRNLQLPITDSEIFKSQTGLDSVESFLFLRGCFFTYKSFEPSWKNPNANYCHYLYLDEFLIDYNKDSNRYFFLWKPNWMSSLIGVVSDLNTNRATTLDLSKLIKKEGHVLVLDLQAKVPFFIVRSDWPN